MYNREVARNMIPVGFLELVAEQMTSDTSNPRAPFVFFGGVLEIGSVPTAAVHSFPQVFETSTLSSLPPTAVIYPDPGSRLQPGMPDHTRPLSLLWESTLSNPRAYHRTEFVTSLYKYISEKCSQHPIYLKRSEISLIVRPNHKERKGLLWERKC